MSLFNLSPTLGTLATATVTVLRPAYAGNGYGTDGTAAAAAFTTFANVRTSFQNIRGDDLQHVPEGDRTTSWQKVWPQMQLQISDRVVHPTKGTFIVQKLDDCVDEGSFTAAFVRKLGDGES